MSRLNNKRQGWDNPSKLSVEPQITGLSSYDSPSGSNTIVSIIGNNFHSYSIISFGIFKPVFYFINSKLLQFNIPNTLNYGIYPIQIFNGASSSNIVTYKIDNAPSYWLLNQNGSISNTNKNTTSIVSISSLSRGLPIILEDGAYSDIYTPYIIPNNINWIICTSNKTTFIQFPIGIDYVGREITIKKTSTEPYGEVYSTYSNIARLADIPTHNSNLVLFATAGNWITFVYNGSLWIAMQGYNI